MIVGFHRQFRSPLFCKIQERIHAFPFGQVFTQGSQIRLRHSILVLLYFGAWKRSQEFSVEADMT